MVSIENTHTIEQRVYIYLTDLLSLVLHKHFNFMKFYMWVVEFSFLVDEVLYTKFSSIHLSYSTLPMFSSTSVSDSGWTYTLFLGTNTNIYIYISQNCLQNPELNIFIIINSKVKVRLKEVTIIYLPIWNNS